MGHFEKDDLLDVFRHEMRLEDEDGPGLCKSLLLNPTRRSKYGGLPLKTRKNSDEEIDKNFDDDYEIPLYEEPLHTRTIINEKLEERTEEKIKEEKREEDKIYKGDIKELFIKKDVKWPLEQFELNEEKKSAVDIYLENNAGCLNNRLASYLQFGAMSDSPSKDILIIFPKSNNSNNEFQSILISVTCSARVREVIGYSMIKYFLTFNKNLEGDVDDYLLYLAEEDGEIEQDLPPLDSSKIIGQLGFECLGLVNRKQASGGRNTKKIVIVYFLDKDHYAIEIDNLEKPLKWLRDEALRLREENVQEKADDGLLKIREYYLEAVDQFDVKLDLEATISSTRSLEFVMIRKNSSRAGFHPRGVRYGRQMSAMLTLKMPNSPIPAAPITPLPTVVEINGDSQNKPLDWSTPTITWSEDGQLSSFVVMRIHRFKPKWKAKLIIRWTSFEIDKFSIDRTAFLPQGYQKKTKVNWEYVGGLKVNKKENKPGRIDTWQISIYWLSPVDDEIIQKVVGDDEWNLKHLLKLYEHEEKWRSVTVESSKKEDVDDMESQITSILQARDAAIYKAFIHSSFGSRTPAASADLALMDSVEGSILSPSDAKNSIKPNGRIRKMSKMIITPIASAVRKTIKN